MKQIFDMLYLIKFEFWFLTLSWPIIAKNYWKGFVGKLSPTQLIEGKLGRD
jgi:hypothetical protein